MSRSQVELGEGAPDDDRHGTSATVLRGRVGRSSEKVAGSLWAAGIRTMQATLELAAAVFLAATAGINLYAAWRASQQRDDLTASLVGFDDHLTAVSGGVAKLHGSIEEKFAYVRGKVDAFMDVILRLHGLEDRP